MSDEGTAHRQTIVGIGEVLLLEKPPQREPSGLAASVASEAVKQGHVGVAVSRLGQDRIAEDPPPVGVSRGLDDHARVRVIDPGLADGGIRPQIVRPQLEVALHPVGQVAPAQEETHHDRQTSHC